MSKKSKYKVVGSQHDAGAAAGSQKSDGQRTAQRSGQWVKAASTAMAAAAVAASVVLAPAQAPSARLAGIHADLQRAVALKQLTPEQAARFEERMARTITSSEADSEA